MQKLRYNYGNTVVIHSEYMDITQSYKTIKVEFSDTDTGYSKSSSQTGEYTTIHEKIALENGKFTARFNRECGGYQDSYGTHLWDVELRHAELKEPIYIGIPTYNILNILKNNTVKNAELKNVHLAIRDRLVVMILDGSSELEVAKYDGIVRNKLTKHKTVKRESGYKYVSTGSELNYLCDATVLASKTSWYRRYGRQYIDEPSEFIYAIRCGNIPITLYNMDMNNADTVSIYDIIKKELKLLNESISKLCEVSKIETEQGLIENIEKINRATFVLNSSMLNNFDTHDSIVYGFEKHNKRPMSKASAWLKEAGSDDIQSELIKFRNKCETKLSKAVIDKDILLPPDYLVYLLRFNTEHIVGVTKCEEIILDSVKRYCMLSNKVYSQLHHDDGIALYEKYPQVNSLVNYDTSELDLIY